MAYSGLLIYDINNKKIVNIIFKVFKPLFTEYFSSILFLNQTDIYLDLVKDLKFIPDCLIVNSSGQIHPFLYGGACDFGLKINVPVIGYTKKLLFGELKDRDEIRNVLKIYYQDRLLGYAIPKPGSKKLLYISVGNNISLKSALNLFFRIDFTIFSKLSNELNNYIQQKQISL